MSAAPPRHVDGNRLWAADGSVWAVWAVDLPTYPFLPGDAKLALHGRVREALVALPPTALLLRTCRHLTPAEVAARVAGGTPPGARDGWRDAVRGDLGALLARRPVERRLHLAARIIAPDARRVLDSALATVAATFGTRGPTPRPPDLRGAAQRAAALGARLARTLPVTPATPAEIAWLHRRAALRGMLDLPPATGPAPAGSAAARTPAETAAAHTAADDAVLWEGGTAADPDRPRHRRYLRVDADGATAFQTTAVLSGMPAAFTYPGGGEWLAAADLAPFCVDWFVRVRAVPNAEAQARARRQRRQLTAQVAEYEGEPAGPPTTLAAAMAGVDDEQAALAANPGDPELQVTTGFVLSGTTPGELDEREAQLRDLLEPWGYALHRPTGGQVALHAAALPGAPTPQVCDDYAQFLLPRDLAAGAPVAGSAVGDPHGIPVGVTAADGQPQPVLLDPAHGPATNRSGSLGVFGALGSGKSYFVKRLLLGAVARGGQVVTLDRTASGEYVRLADVAAGRAAVVALEAGSPVGLDPLRTFDGEEGIAVALGFLSVLTRTSPSEVDGAVLAAAVREVGRAGGGLADVAGVLDRDADPEAHGLRRKLAACTGHPLAELVFGDLPPLRLDADLVVFHAPGLALPDRDALLHEHLARQLLPEQIFGQALLYLVAAVSRALTFRDPTRFGATLVDEAWALTASPQGRQLLLDSIRDGRKHNAAVWVLSQHPDDLGDDALSHLLGMRALFRQDRGAAPAALRSLGLEPTDDLVELLAGELRTGQCLLRDVAGRVGLVQVVEAADAAQRTALDTTPAAVA